MLLGKRITDPDVTRYLKYSGSKIIETEKGELAAQVMYRDE